ncbi:MAG: S8 family serine peptidase [Propionibacteriaceae bacterium]
MARKPMVALLAASALALSLASTIPANATDTTEPAKPVSAVTSDTARFIVNYAEGFGVGSENRSAAQSQVVDIVNNFGRSVAEARTLGTGSQVVVLNKELTPAEAESFMAKLQTRPGIESVEVDVKIQRASTPTDPDYRRQWDLKGAPGGLNWEPIHDRYNGNGVVVAVVDTGITRHPDLEGQILPGYDMISDASVARDGTGRDADATDEGDWVEADDKDCNDRRKFESSSWHGSHVAGTIVAKANNGIGITGVAPGSKVVPVRVLGRCGGFTSDIVDGMMWAAGLHIDNIPDNPNPAKVINASLGGGGACSSTQQRAINMIMEHGTTLVFAAGNSNKDATGFNPASCSGNITVASNGPSGAMAYYSNYGSRIDVMAPGGDVTNGQEDGIYSTVNMGTRQKTSPGYTYMQGTSMASPHVAGVVALMYQANPNITPNQVKQILKQTSRKVSCPKGCGAGQVDTSAAVNASGGSVNPGPTPKPTVTPTAPKPTVTPTAPKPTDPSSSVLLNGGFEEGTKGWAGNTSTITTDTKWPARSGAAYARLNGRGAPNVNYIGQRVTIPKDGQIQFYLNVKTDEISAAPNDTLKVQVFSTSGRYLGTAGQWSNAHKSYGYALRVADLSQYAGQQVEIRFVGEEDGSKATTFLIDDVKLSGLS